ncbi:(Fe-S)-binding protein [Candidatus Thorarchaeota archaeon]|nr:MAG: (Fe-S)-binding protein [Candidatus Thorarchaeota archaeon]
MDAEKLAEKVRMCAACPKMCRHVCPTFFAWRSDAPTPHGRALVLHQEIAGTRPLDDRAIEVLYQCLECSHCLTWCKPEIDIAEIVEERRRGLVREGRRPAGLDKMAEAVKETNNPFGESHDERNRWLEFSSNEGVPIVYFTGCTAAYREREIASSTVSLLESLGFSVKVSQDEVCCGSPLFRTGDEEAGLACAEMNAESLNSLEAEEIVVTCPGCYRVLTEDYPQLGIHLDKPVRHISELLAENIEKLPSRALQQSVTYHDPCHLGRHSGIYDEPRTVIERIIGEDIREMERTRENAMCCGNGAGLRTLFPEHAKSIGSERISHAEFTGADILVTACPFCKNMLASRASEDLEVLDLPELVARGLAGSDAKSD